MEEYLDVEELKKMHPQNLMEAMCYNLYRSPGIIVSYSEN